MTLEFKDFKGVALLSGVDMGVETVTRYGATEEKDCITFILNGTTYRVTEDMNDGYRSSVGSFRVVKDKVLNTFPHQEVLCRHRTKGSYSGEDDVLELLSLRDSSVILKVGTENIGDYYPNYVAWFYPENLGSNPNDQ